MRSAGTYPWFAAAGVGLVVVHVLGCGDGRQPHADAGPPAVDATADTTADVTSDASTADLSASTIDAPVSVARTWLDDPLAPPPSDLADVGLFPAFPALDVLHPRALAFEPRYPLYSNGLDKTRQLVLPIDGNGQVVPIDARVRDAWDFPVGTLAWKTFTFVDPVRGRRPVETRLIRRAADSGDPTVQWEFFVWQWNDEGTAATLIEPDAFQRVTPRQVSVRGETFTHNIPRLAHCWNCHLANASVLIGFDELRLGGVRAGDTVTQLQDIVARAWLNPPPQAPYAQVAAARSADEQQVVEYLHANCAHCHNGISTARKPGLRYPQLDLRHDQALASTLGVRTMSVASAPGVRIVPGDPGRSILLHAMKVLADPSVNPEAKPMPAVGVDHMDAEAVALIERWIAALPVAAPGTGGSGGTSGSGGAGGGPVAGSGGLPGPEVDAATPPVDSAAPPPVDAAPPPIDTAPPQPVDTGPPPPVCNHTPTASAGATKIVFDRIDTSAIPTDDISRRDDGPAMLDAMADLKFVPGRSDELFLLQKRGRVTHLRLAAAPARTSTVLATVQVPGVETRGDCGVLSLAFDPGFASNGLVYFGQCTGPTTSKIARYTYDGATLRDPVDIISYDGTGSMVSWHTVGSMGFDAAGNLWMVHGEFTNTVRAQSLSDPLGKLIRIVPSRSAGVGGYQPAPGNPFSSAGAPNAAVYAYGLRSPWRATLDRDGRYLIGDVGDGRNEELNVVTQPGQNFGWGLTEATSGPCEAPCRGPEVYWRPEFPYEGEGDPLLEAETGTVIWVGTQYVDCGNDRYRGSLTGLTTFGDLYRGWVRGLALGPDGRKTVDVSLMRRGTGKAGITAMAQGPDGYLYATTLGPYGGDLQAVEAALFRLLPE